MRCRSPSASPGSRSRERRPERVRSAEAGAAPSGGADVRLEDTLRAKRDSGKKLLVPYVTGGLGAAWLDVVRAVAAAGADAIEIGIPFSDPVMDGRTIQEASQRALDIGATQQSIVADLARAEIGVPIAVMTYYNPVHHAGSERFAAQLVAGNV